jgi:hypothetical protein
VRSRKSRSTTGSFLRLRAWGFGASVHFRHQRSNTDSAQFHLFEACGASHSTGPEEILRRAALCNAIAALAWITARSHNKDTVSINGPPPSVRIVPNHQILSTACIGLPAQPINARLVTQTLLSVHLYAPLKTFNQPPQTPNSFPPHSANAPPPTESLRK